MRLKRYKTQCVEIENMLVRELLKRRDQSATKRDNSPNRISAAGELECQSYLRRTGAPTVGHTAHQQYTFELGHTWHAYWQRLAHDCGLGYCQMTLDDDGEVGFRGLAEITVGDPALELLGHIDLLSRPLIQQDDEFRPNYESGKCLIIDFKTVSNQPKVYHWKKAKGPFVDKDGVLQTSYWKRLRVLDGSPEMIIPTSQLKIVPGDWDALDHIKDEHRLQAMEYARCVREFGLPRGGYPEGWPVTEAPPPVWGAEPPATPEWGSEDRVYPDVVGICIVYLCKDKGPYDWADPLDEEVCPIKTFVEPYDRTVLDEYHERLKRLNASVKEKRMPERAEWPGGQAFPCYYCNHRHACRPESFDGAGRPVKTGGKK